MAVIDGDAGDNELFGTAAADTITGFAGFDTLIGDAGADTLFGGADNDTLYGDDGNDSLDGGTGEDSLYGGANNDTLNGGADNDLITDNFGTLTSIQGGAGDDRIMLGDTILTGTVDGGADRDVLSTTGNISGLTLSNIEVLETQGGTTRATLAQLDAFDSIVAYDDPANLNDAVNLEVTGGGTADLTDELQGRGASITVISGATTLTTSDGNDTIIGSTSADSLNGGAGDDYIDTAAGNDTAVGGSGIDTLYGEAGNDSLTGDAGEDSLYGGANNDVLDAGADNDLISDDAGTLTSIQGGAGDDRIELASTILTGTIDGGADRDVLRTYFNNLSGLTLSNIEVLETQGGTTRATLAQLDAFDSIVTYDDPANLNDAVNLEVTGGGTADLTDELQGRGASITVISGATTLTTSDGNDTIIGSTSADSLNGGAGDDYIDTAAGNDTAVGGSGIDTLYGEAGNDSLTGDAGEDSLYGGANNDVLDAGADNDLISDDAGTLTSIQGGAGDDRIELASTILTGTIDGGADRDVLRTYFNNLSGLTLSNIEVLETQGGTTRATLAQLDAFDSIVTYDDPANLNDAVNLEVTGGGTADLTDELQGRGASITVISGATTLTTSDGNDLIYGGSGDDSLAAGAGEDDLTGSGGNDNLSGGADNDLLYGGAANDSLFGGTGEDSLYGGDSNDHLDGGADNDLIQDSTGTLTTIAAGGGDDRIQLGTSVVSGMIDGGLGRDILSPGGANLSGLTLTGLEVLETAYNTVTATAAQLDGFDSIVTYDDPAEILSDVSLQLTGGGSGDLSDELGSRAVELTIIGVGTTVTTGSGNDIIYGGTGDDSVTTGDGIDTIYGGAGNDRLDGGLQADEIDGGLGNDTLIGGDGADTLYGGGGNDAIDGGTGNDVIDDTSGTAVTIQGGANDDLITISSASASGTIDGGADRDVLTASGANLSGLTLSGLEVLVTGGGTVTATAAQLDAFSSIVQADDPGSITNAVRVNVTGGGALDLTDELSGRAVTVVVVDSGTTATGGTGDDTLIGGAGADALTGGNGADTVNGGDGNDVLTGGDGNDSLDGGNNNDTINGGVGDDSLSGGSGNDMLSGGVGNDSFEDFVGLSVSMSGGDGNDIFSIGTSGTLTGAIDGGLNRDVLNAFTSDISGLSISGVEVLATQGDFITATASQLDAFDIIVRDDSPGSAGLSVALDLVGGGSLDLSDELGSRSVSLTIRGLAASVTGGSGDDGIFGDAADDSMSGGTGNDTLYGGGGLDRLFGGVGNDFLSDGQGDDLVFGGDGNDEILGSLGTDTLDGGSSTDTLFLQGDRADWDFTGTAAAMSGQSAVFGLGLKTILNMEFVEFDDGTFAAADLLSSANQAPAITSNGGGANGAISLTEGTTAVTIVSATDPDAGAILTYRIAGGADASQFTISATTGALNFIAPPNFGAPADAGANNVYDVIVQVSDGALTDSQAVAVTVTDVNAAPVINSNGGGVAGAVSIAENGTVATFVTATDPDTGTVFAYAITGGADAARFAINATTGALTFVAPPNFEAPADAGANNIYDVIVRASDGTLTDSQALAVTVTNANEAPVITSNGGAATAAISLAENGTDVTTLAASDPDAGATWTFSLAGGADAARFAINATTGALTFVAPPNFEAPADAGANNIYDVIVRASDGTLTDSQALAVTVTNGTAGFTVTGTRASNIIRPPSEENDIISTLAGKDTLDGGLGVDRLSGGTGKDSFVFSTRLGSSNVDVVTDFKVKDDTFRLDDAIFAKLAGGSLFKSAFVANLSGNATDKKDRILYETDTGNLYYDRDGKGGAAKVLIADLADNLALTHKDFFVF